MVRFIIASLIVAALLILLGIFWFWITPVVSTNILLVADPMLLFVFDAADKKVVLVKVPSDVRVEGLYGVGMYSLESLWKLGVLEKKTERLLTESLEEALGVPIPWYVYPREERVVPISAPEKTLRNMVNPRTILPLFQASYRTNIPPFVFLKLIRIVNSVPPEQLNILDLTNAKIYSTSTLPDGSMVRTIDPNLFDAYIGSAFEVSEIRTEALTLAIYNTTKTSLLGNRMSRLLGNTGVHVIVVDNDDEEVDACVLGGSKDHLSSRTATFISNHFGCKNVEKSEEGVADLTLAIGLQYARRFSSR